MVGRMNRRDVFVTDPWFFKLTMLCAAVTLLVFALLFTSDGSCIAAEPGKAKTPSVETSKKKPASADETPGRELSWEMPGRLSIYDLQFGPAIPQDHGWKFLGNSRTFNAGLFGDRLILMIRFSFRSSTSDTPLKFVVKLPDSRQYEETVRLTNRQGMFNYHFTIHRPEDFLGSGMIYIYYGFSIVDVLDFTIMPGS
jgi:hypothetical protein